MNQQQFYKTKAWFKCATGYRKHVLDICERCDRACYRKNDKRYIDAKQRGEDVRFGIVHHKIHLNDTNINDPYISLDWNNLELLCVDCHNKEHMQKNIEVREDITFDSEGRVIPIGKAKKEIHY